MARIESLLRCVALHVVMLYVVMELDAHHRNGRTSTAMGQTLLKPLIIGDVSYCQDLSEFSFNQEVCASNESRCGLDNAAYTSPCAQGNGICPVASSSSCNSCMNTAPNYAVYATSMANGVCAPPTTNIVFQAQPFIIANRAADEPEVILPLFSKTESVSVQSLGLSSVTSTNVNMLLDSTYRTLPTNASFSDAFTTNVYYSAFLVDAVDCASSTTSYFYNGAQVPKGTVSLQVGVGLVLWNATKANRMLYPIDPLGEIDPILDLNDNYASTVGAINFTSQFAQIIRYNKALTSFSYGASAFTGTGTTVALHSATSALQPLSSDYTNVAVSSTIPVSMDQTIANSGVAAVNISITVQQLKVAAAMLNTSILYGGTAPRAFTTSVGPSRRFSSSVLHRTWNVFASGSQNRSASYILSPLETASSTSGVNLMLPITIFSNDSERQQVLNRVGSPLSNFYFELVYPVRIQILPTVAKVIHWSDGTFDTFPLSLSDGIPYTAPLTSGNADIFNAFSLFFGGAGGTGKIASFQQMGGTWVSVAYIPLTPNVIFFGNNNYGQFGFGGGEMDQVFPKSYSGSSYVTNIAVGLLSQTDVAQIAVGETQLLVRTASGRLFFAGSSPIGAGVYCPQNSSIEFDSATFIEMLLSNGSSKVFTVVTDSLISKYDTNFLSLQSLKVLSVAAGYLYSALLVQATVTLRSGTRTTKHLIMCGGSYISGDSAGGVKDLSSPQLASGLTTFPLDTMTYDTLHSGRFHLCATGTLSNVTGKQSLACVGTLDALSSGVASNLPNATIPLWSNRTYAGGPLEPSLAVTNVLSTSVGMHHVVAIMQEGDFPTPAGNITSYRTFSNVMTSGSNQFGQLGAAMRSPSMAPMNFVNPQFPIPEVITSTRGPNAYIKANQFQGTQASAKANYQLFETVAAQALFNNTYIFQRSRVFNTPRDYLNNVSSLLHQPPPDGKYSLTTIFADAVPEVNPFYRDQGFLNRLQNASGRATSAVNFTDLVWDVRFNVIKGLALFLVQTQTSSNGRWFVPQTIVNTADATPNDQKDCSLEQLSGFPMQNISSTGVDGVGTFYRDWSILRRNITHAPTTRYVNATTLETKQVTTVLLPSVFFLTSTGKVYPKSRLLQNGSGNRFWYDPVAKIVVCNWHEESIPAAFSGYSQLLGSNNVQWVSMLVSVEAVNITTLYTLNTTNSSTDVTVNVNVSNPSTELDNLVSSSLGDEQYAQRSSYWFCKPIFNLYDCSSLVFYQQFYSLRPSPASFMAFAKGGLSFSELPLGGKTGYLRLTMANSWRRLARVCVLLKLGVLTYLVYLDGIATNTEGIVLLCNGSQTDHLITWSAVGTSEDRLNIVTAANISFPDILVPSSFYTGSSTPTPNLDENNVTMVMSGHGAVAVGTDNSRQPSAYMVFMNETLSAMLHEQGSTPLSSGVMSSADNSFISIDGSYGVYSMPVTPAVSNANMFVMWIQPEGYISKDDFLVLRIRSKYQDASSTGLQLSIGANGTTLEVINVTQRAAAASKQFFTSQCVLVWTVADIVAQFASNPSRFYCRPFPLSITSWTRISLLRDPSQINLMSVYMDSELVARGRHDSIANLFSDVGSIQLTLRNRYQDFSSPIQVREIAFCLDNIGIGVTDGPNPFPCVVGTKVLNRFHLSTSASVSETVSQSAEVSRSTSFSGTSISGSKSTSVSESEMRTSSRSSSLTQEVSESETFTNETISHTVNITNTHSKSHTIQKNVSVVPVTLNTASLSAYNIRKTGVPIVLLLEQDEFNPRQDWTDSPNAYMHCVSSLTLTMNPSGFCASFSKKGFASGFITPSNRSILQVTFGPAIFYNSYADEVVSLTFLTSGAASEFTIKGSINFTVAGVGYRITTALRQIEAAGALFALASLGLGGPSSNVMRIATNSIFLNFHCFNDENYPLSWLVSPTNTEVKGSEKIGVAVVTFSLMMAIVSFHLALVVIVYFKKRDTFLKAQGDVYFPGLTIGVCVILLPGYISGAWQGAVQSDLSGYIVLVVVTTAIIVSVPLLFLIRTLYDTAYFTATFAPFDREVWASFIMKYPVMARVIPSGVWHSTDRHYSFVRRFTHIIWEYRDTMQHWFCIEFAEGVVVGSVGALTNSNPVVCMAQLACFIAIKLCIFIALVRLRPHGTLFGQWPATLITLMQLISLIFVLIDASKGGTNAYQQAYTVMLFVIAMILTVHSLITCGVLIRYRYLKRRERKLMHAVAEVYANHHLDANELYQEEAPATTQEARLAAASHQYPSKVKYLPEGTMVKVVDIPIKLLLEDDDTVEEEMAQIERVPSNLADESILPATSEGGPVQSLDSSPTEHDSPASPTVNAPVGRVPMTLVDRMAEINAVNESGLRLSRKQYRTAESRNFWRAAAMESLTGAPMTDIPYDPDAEFL
ncbi:transmembrane protein, putative [Bodo saltans]|uniref:Transmembrane protein, putative n=1 Tax=Bodo saltans TaxID=75058 RepID=A0A0S4JNG4_BODSA|nr:transmembrane protein, putative [Bodo saltans]|eukprot:CUG91759.1 transmembrane protein, putative [Bodo saltans]